MKIKPATKKEVMEIEQFDIDDFLNVYRLQKIKIDSAKKQMEEAIHRMAVLISAIMTKKEFKSKEEAINWVNAEMDNPERFWNK